ncbi:MAG: ATP-binding protein [Acidobacteriaceae bacterium]|nr:ATP-binding protein [Acidobacteriaceae bacterium]
MTQTESRRSWIEQNQEYLLAEFARLRHLLSSDVAADLQDAGSVRAAMDAPPAIDQIAAIFGLSDFERELLLLCAGVEMDSALAQLSSDAQRSPKRTCATFGLAIACLADAHWSALTPSRPLRRFCLIDVELGQPLTSAPLRIDERILHYLAGINLVDARLDRFLRRAYVPAFAAEEHKRTSLEIADVLQRCPEEPPLVHLCGNDPEGREDVATFIADSIDKRLFVLRSEDVPAPGPEFERFVILCEREMLLFCGALLIQCGLEDVNAPVRRMAERLPGVVFLGASEPVKFDRAFLRFDVNKPAAAEQKRLWEEALGPSSGTLNGTLEALAQHFRFSARTIFATGMSAGAVAGEQRVRELWTACRSLARPKLENLAQRIVPRADWSDLVLPDAQLETLRQLTSQVRHRMRVYDTWGFAAKGQRGLGVSALFAGDSGTGKTLAAEVIARDLDLDMYRIDLSSVVSKFIGETEKNLRRVFDAAEEGGVVLLFDEADALFGKRSEVKDSHDRYANIEVSYLLQRMEAYQGLAILTTNLKASLDRSFQRRLRFIVNFPFPDAAYREAIWSRIFPPNTPTENLDPRRLSQLNVAGGNIRNIALNAAFLAAELNQPVSMTHVLAAARLESEKIERPLSAAEIRGWV